MAPSCAVWGPFLLTENTFWQALRAKLVPHVYALKLNLRFVKGVPDCWLSGPKGDLWLELKYLKTVPPMVDPTTLLTVLQQQWLSERHKEGRSVGVLIGSPSGHLYFPSLSWQQPISREDFVARAKPTKEIAIQLLEVISER